MDFSLESANKNAKVTYKERTVTENLTEIAIHVAYDVPTTPDEIVMRWAEPCVDTCPVWTPGNGLGRAIMADWWQQVSHSRLAMGAPVMDLVSKTGKNRLCIAHSDPNNSCKIMTGLCEETGEFKFTVRFLTEPMSPITAYDVTLRLDRRSIRFDDAVRDAVSWWEKEYGYVGAYVPRDAKMPLYSAWYSYHQNVHADELVEECKLAKKLGMETIIVDDGWQTDNALRGYSYCGDWEAVPSKIPDMKEFVDRVHKVGMKVMIWYSVPFVGVHSKAFERFKGMFLSAVDPKTDTYLLDPRYPEVRRYLSDIYTKAVREWGLDGLKLDFIDSFALNEYSLKEDPRRDIPSLEAALDTLLNEVTAELKKSNPEVLIEFRQGYIGPTIRKYGNMLRVGDCPDDPIHNRIGTVDLRMTSGDTAVHSDMLMWHKEDSIEAISLQFLSVMFSVPQISVRIAEITGEQYRTLERFLSFWIAHRDVLAYAPVHAEDPDSNYSLVYAGNDKECIAVAHIDKPFCMEAGKKLYFFNATGGETLTVRPASGIAGKTYTVWDCTGRRMSSGMLTGGTLYAFDVPVGGMVEIEAN